MILKYDFFYKYNYENLLFFIDFHAREQELPFAIDIKKGLLSLYVEGKKEQLISFNEEVLGLIPSSLYALKQEVSLEEGALPSVNYQKPSFKNEFLPTPMYVKQGFNEFKKSLSLNLAEVLKRLESGEIVSISDTVKVHILDNEYSHYSCISTLNDFLIDEKEALALYSLERPILHLKHKEHLGYEKLRLPFSIDIFELLQKLPKIKVIDEEEVLELALINKDLVFLNGKEEQFKKERVELDLSLSKPIKSIYKLGERELFEIKLPRDLAQFKELLSQREGGSILLANYNLVLHDFKANKAQNIFALFEIAKSLLGFKKEVLVNAREFQGKKGPRIDCKIDKEGLFDSIRFLRSCMSFCLAGVDEELLSFGMIESFAYLITDLLDNESEEVLIKVVSDINFLSVIARRTSKDLGFRYGKL